MSGSGYLKFRNDRAAPEIRIGVREFVCTPAAEEVASGQFRMRI